MNPSNPFGSPQGGAFQAPSNTMKTGLFQSFGQQSSSNQPQTVGFFTPSAFGQPSVLNQAPAPQGNTLFGQAPAFGQASTQPTVSQAPAFGQPSLAMSSSGFGSTTTPAFGQASGPNQKSVFGQTPAFGQPSAFGQASGFSQQTPGFSKQPTGFAQQPSGFGNSQMATTSTTALGQPQPLGFGQTVFGQPSSTSVTTSVFGTAQSVTQNRGFGSSKFSFKPANEALFKPIFSASPEPTNPQTTSMSSSPFGSTLALKHPLRSPPPHHLSVSQPKPPCPRQHPFLEEPVLVSPQHLEKPNQKPSTDEKGSLGDTNVFARLSKGTKRKDDPAVPSTAPENLATEEDVSADLDSPRHPSKRPLMRSRGAPGGLFGRALLGLRKDVGPARREGTQQASTWEETETEREEVQDQSDDLPATPPTERALTRDVLEKAEESDSAKVPDPNLETTTPVKHGVRRESSESLSGMSPSDCTTIHCRNVPPALNKKDVLEKHFGRFGKVRKVICRPAKNLATVHFDDHASAVKAKKKGKLLHRHELLLLWQRKKQSPGDKGRKPSAETEEAVEESQEDTQSKAASSPLRRPAPRAPALGSMVSFNRSSPVKKSPLAKSLQFDTEPQKESGTEAQSSERAVPSSLLHLIGQVAESAEEKYRLLEQRDKILRQGRPKRTDLDLSKVFVGKCPDMCPEKERFMRETRKQLSMFEVLPDTETVDHKAAIKEYSRSSADQEEPLPYELRPLPVLSMTMDYLVTQIMDQGHDNYREWYDFVWNRTRGIRKDITQQHLCCPDTVSLIEKCTRFHVHCAHHLCEEHISSFDAKINNENMTKCLQSLKEMYQDLATRQTYCPREAEFRQYSVLLRLNDGDILREVQQFRDVVRNSPEVKFAVQAFTAVNSNNFVRFFKLVKGASYLSSCLLHRYFNQVRAKALKTLNWAHTVGPRPTAFPVEDIVRMLMFRNIAEATDFIQQYSLNINDDGVELSRGAYQEPDLPPSQKKSEVILAKKTMLIGEVVNGGPLPNRIQHIPVCSFDSQNKYRGEGPLAEHTPSQFKAVIAKLEVMAPPRAELLPRVMPSVFGLPVTDKTGEPSGPYSSVQADPELFQPIPQPQPVKPPSPPPKPQPVYSNEDVMAVLDCVIEEVVKSAVREVADAGASYATTALAESSVQAESLVSEVLGQMLQEMSSTEIKLEQERIAEEKRKLEEARRRQEHQTFLIQFSFSLCTEIIHEVLDETIKETATSEIQQAVNEKADRVAKCTEQVCSSLVEETLNADITLLVEHILEAELQRIHKYIKRWRDVVAVRRQLKRQMRGFPAAPCCVDPRFKLKALAPSAPAQPSIADLARGLVNLGNSGTLALSSTSETVWAPLDLPELVTENISNPPDRIFWKTVLLLPSDHESVASLADRILSDWLEVKLGGGNECESREEQLDGTLQTLCVINKLQEKEQRLHKVHISVKASRGPLTEDGLSKMEECGELHGTGALITLLPAMPIVEPGQDEQDVPLLSALLQLKQLQQASTWHCPLPLVILVPGSDSGTGDTQKLEEALMLHTLVEEGLISEYTFLFIPETTSDLQGSKQLIQAMRWLLARAPPPFPLSCRTLVQLVEASLSREFIPRVYAHRQERAAARLPSEDPAPVIQLYNAVLAYVADKVSSEELSRLSWPPGEFCLPDTRDFVPHLGWNSVQHLTWLREAILSLQLPQWEKLSATDSWSELCSSIFRYATQIPVSHHSQPLLMSRLENLLEKVRIRKHLTRIPGSKVTTSSWSDLDEDVCPAFSRIPWGDVLLICIDHKLKDWQIPGSPVCEDAVTEDGEILVYLPTESLKSFQPPEEWSQAIRQTHREKQQEKEGQRLFHTLVEPLEAPPAPLDITHTPTAQELLAHKVLRSLEKEKAESKRSMEQLQRWLDGDPVDHLSTPLFIPSSTLLSMPTTITHSPTSKNRDAARIQVPEPDDLSDKADCPKATPVSMTQRLKELERQILASQEEELACRLKLSGLLSIVDD
ncbi:Germinal-center associated nuclear protein [Collichthys lucidus]|uniref:Germinal-center associated nuclear protein n=1 Tax=Collichthys lucidus TaxID=240159 RepID=A0A4U5U0R8_COLLU|nr:Germinal-center associated nuclear protein [Collichthys lucidus]